MKRIAALTAALLLMLSLSLSVFAADLPADTAQQQTESVNADETTEETEALGLQIAAENAVPDRIDYRYDRDPVDEAPETPSETTASSRPATSDMEPPITEPFGSIVMIVLIISGVLLLIIVVVIVILLLRKRTPSDGEHPVHSGSIRGLAIEIEMLNGLCYNESLSFHMRRNLTIGTDPGCDIVFEDAQLQPMHAVISRASGAVTIAECGEFGCTYVGGMKIFSANRLRSGDIITVGSTSFRIVF